MTRSPKFGFTFALFLAFTGRPYASELPSGKPNLVFPQFANGEVGGVKNSTRLIIRVTGDSGASGQVHFSDPDGNSLEVPFGGEMKHTLDFALPAWGTLDIESDGTGDLVSGVAEIYLDSGDPAKVEGTLVFQVLGHPVSVGDSPPGSSHQVYVSSTPGENTGVAFFNCDPDTASVLEIVLLNAFGEQVAITQLEIGARSQLSVFIDDPELFKGFFDANLEQFIGTLNISVIAGSPVSVVGMIQDRDTGSLVAVTPGSSAFRLVPPIEGEVEIVFDARNFIGPEFGSFSWIDRFTVNSLGDLVVAVRALTPNQTPRALFARIQNVTSRILETGQVLRFGNKDVEVTGVGGETHLADDGTLYMAAGLKSFGGVIFRWQDGVLETITTLDSIGASTGGTVFAIWDWVGSPRGDFAFYTGVSGVAKNRFVLRYGNSGEESVIYSDRDGGVLNLKMSEGSTVAFQVGPPTERKTLVNQADTEENVSIDSPDLILDAVNDLGQTVFLGESGLLVHTDQTRSILDFGSPWPPGSTDTVIKVRGFMAPGASESILLWVETESLPDALLKY